MATPASESAAGCAVAGAWACGWALQIDSISQLFARYPALGFIALSTIGGAVGWCLLIERGAFDGAAPKPMLRTLLVRVVIGAGVGVAASILWDAFDAQHRGTWMLIAALVAMFPVEAASGSLPEIIEKWRRGPNFPLR